MKARIQKNIIYRFFVYMIYPLISFCRELFEACKGRRLTVLWIATIFLGILMSSNYYIKNYKDKFGIAIDISNISSNDHVIFKVNKKDKSYADLKKGDYISFNTDKLEPFVSKDYTIIKKVIGKEGDHVQIKGLGVYVNGKKYGELHPIALQKINKTVNQMQTDYFIPKNTVFVLGSYKRSYDSRYWGVLPIEPKSKIDIATPILF